MRRNPKSQRPALGERAGAGWRRTASYGCPYCTTIFPYVKVKKSPIEHLHQQAKAGRLAGDHAGLFRLRCAFLNAQAVATW